ncbi:MAG: MoaD/ThiS family protein [Armatimonadetes bacterium]|nr:MoaD/ThiS family protein [Armatimonadota bacterium]
MTLKVKYFAVLRERRGLAEETVEVEPTTAGGFTAWILREHSLGLPPALVRLAMDGTFLADDEPLRDGAEVVLIPPVAGG